MENLMMYILKSSLVLSVVYILYQLLRNDLAFKRNRILLLSGVFLSLFLPLINFSSFYKPEPSMVVFLSPIVIDSKNISDVVNYNFSLFTVFIALYFTGVSLLLTKRLIEIYKLIGFIRRSDIITSNINKIVFTDNKKSPFSFFNIIFISNGLTAEEYKTIIAHEHAHISKHHSIDVLFMELLVIAQWINPLVWLYRISLREVHEFQADRFALSNGIEKAGYIQLLLAMALKTNPVNLTNSFCQIKLKRRLKMITKIRNSRFTGLKFALTIPVMVLFLWIVSCDNSTKTSNSDDSQTPSSVSDSTKTIVPPAANNSVTKEETDEVFTVVEDMPKYPGGDEARSKFMVSNIKYPQVAKEKGIQGTVIVSFMVDIDGSVKDAKVLRGIGGGCDEEALRVVKMMPKWNPGKQSGKNVKVAFNMPVKFALG